MRLSEAALDRPPLGDGQMGDDCRRQDGRVHRFQPVDFQPRIAEIVHTLRGRVDAILVGRGTVRRDNPLLTARPQGVRTAVRVIADSRAALSSDSQLAKRRERSLCWWRSRPRPTNRIAAVC